MVISHSLLSKSLKIIDDIYAQKYIRSTSFLPLEESDASSRQSRLFDELRNSELTYKQDLSHLLTCCGASRSRALEGGVEGAAARVGAVTQTVRSLITKHTHLARILSQPGCVGPFVEWMELVSGLYTRYIDQYKDDIDAVDYEKELTRKPLMKIRYFTKFLETLIKMSAEAHEFEHIDQLSNALESVSAQLVNARSKLEAELQDTDANTIDFGSVKLLDRMTPCAAAFSLASVARRDRFFMSLKHPQGGMGDTLCEAFLLSEAATAGFALAGADAPTRMGSIPQRPPLTSLGSGLGLDFGGPGITPPPVSGAVSALALCSIQPVGRSLLFPPFRRGELSILALDAGGVTLTPSLSPDPLILLHLEFLDPTEASGWVSAFRELFQNTLSSLALVEDFHFSGPPAASVFKNISGVGKRSSEYSLFLSAPVAPPMVNADGPESPFIEKRPDLLEEKTHPYGETHRQSPSAEPVISLVELSRAISRTISRNEGVTQLESHQTFRLEMTVQTFVLDVTRLGLTPLAPPLTARDISEGPSSPCTLSPMLIAGSSPRVTHQAVASGRVGDRISSPIGQTASSTASFREPSDKSQVLNTSPLDLSFSSQSEGTAPFTAQSPTPSPAGHTPNSTASAYDFDDGSFSDFEIVTSNKLPPPVVRPDFTFAAHAPSFAPGARDFSTFGKEYKPNFAMPKKSFFLVFKKKKPVELPPPTPTAIFNQAKERSSPMIQQREMRKASTGTVTTVRAPPVADRNGSVGSVATINTTGTVVKGDGHKAVYNGAGQRKALVAPTNRSSSTLVLDRSDSASSSQVSRNPRNLTVEAAAFGSAPPGPLSTSSSTSLPAPFAPATFSVKRVGDTAIREVRSRNQSLFDAACRASRWQFNQWQQVGATDVVRVSILASDEEAYLLIEDEDVPVVLVPLDSFTTTTRSNSLDVEVRTHEHAGAHAAFLIRSESASAAAALRDWVETASSAIRRLSCLHPTDTSSGSSVTGSGASVGGMSGGLSGGLSARRHPSTSLTSLPSTMHYHRPSLGQLLRMGSFSSSGSPQRPLALLIVSDSTRNPDELLLMNNEKVSVYHTLNNLDKSEVSKVRNYSELDASRLRLLALTGIERYRVVMGKHNVLVSPEGVTKAGKRRLRIVPCDVEGAYLVVFSNTAAADRFWALIDLA